MMVLACSSLVFVASLWIDNSVITKLDARGMPGDLRRIVDLTEIFAHGFGAALTLILICVLAPHLRHRLQALAGCFFMPGMAVQGIKLLVARKRPMAYGSHLPESSADAWFGLFPAWQLGSEYDYQSFPSAHAATAVAMAIGLSWVCPRGKFVFMGLAILSCIQRVTSGAHWVSDTVFGAMIAVVVCFIIFRCQRGMEARMLRKLRRVIAKEIEQENENDHEMKSQPHCDPGLTGSKTAA